MGSLSREIDDMARDNPTLVKYLEAAGSASLTDSYFSTMLLIMAVLAAGFAVSSALRLRSEETAGRSRRCSRPASPAPGGCSARWW